MKNIIFIRHAKSSWENALDDFNRGLLDIGIEKTIKIALATAPLITNEYVIWSSPARRALETAQIVKINWPKETQDIIIKPGLYTFDVTALENIIMTCEDTVKKLIIFGHNEAITDFVNKFGDAIIDNVPTSGFVALEMNTNSWKKLIKGHTAHIIFPKNLGQQ